ncbi:MAG: MqnA/MqnD/SBP family protein [Gaiellaceae bacterium]
MLIRVGHTPSADDAFMFWALATGQLDDYGFEVEPVAADIETLNRWALHGWLELTGVSLHAYPFVQDRYVLLAHGASIGTGYGPVVVSRRPLSREELRASVVAVPGRTTTSMLVLRMYLGGEFAFRELAADRIIEEVKSGRMAAGLVFDERLLTYEDEGLVKSVDLGEWWLLETGLPLPLTVNVARRDLGPAILSELSDAVRESILTGLDNRRRAMAYAMRFGRSSDASITARFVGMYVNELSFDFGNEGQQAIEELLRRAEQIGAFLQPVRIEFAA